MITPSTKVYDNIKTDHIKVKLNFLREFTKNILYRSPLLNVGTIQRLFLK